MYCISRFGYFQFKKTNFPNVTTLMPIDSGRKDRRIAPIRMNESSSTNDCVRPSPFLEQTSINNINCCFDFSFCSD